MRSKCSPASPFQRRQPDVGRLPAAGQRCAEPQPVHPGRADGVRRNGRRGHHARARTPIRRRRRDGVRTPDDRRHTGSARLPRARAEPLRRASQPRRSHRPHHRPGRTDHQLGRTDGRPAADQGRDRAAFPPTRRPIRLLRRSAGVGRRIRRSRVSGRAPQPVAPHLADRACGVPPVGCCRRHRRLAARLRQLRRRADGRRSQPEPGGGGRQGCGIQRRAGYGILLELASRRQRARHRSARWHPGVEELDGRRAGLGRPP